MKKLLVGATLAGAAILFTPALLESMEAPAIDPNAPISKNEYREIVSSFNLLKNYWAGQKAGMAAVKLAILEGDQMAYCPNGDSEEVSAHDPDAVMYCPLTNTIILSQAGINTLDGLSRQNQLSPHSTKLVVLAHEMGHAVQNADGQTEDGKTTKQVLEMELQADCYAGEMLQIMEPDIVINDTQNFYDNVAASDSPTHGDSEARILNFGQGAVKDTCEPSQLVLNK